MPQSNVIFGFLFAAFVVFITTRGRLPEYAAVFIGTPSGGSGGSGSPSIANVGSYSGSQALAKTANDAFLGATGGKLGLLGGDWSPSGIIGNIFGTK